MQEVQPKVEQAYQDEIEALKQELVSVELRYKAKVGAVAEDAEIKIEEAL